MVCQFRHAIQKDCQSNHQFNAHRHGRIFWSLMQGLIIKSSKTTVVGSITLEGSGVLEGMDVGGDVGLRVGRREGRLGVGLRVGSGVGLGVGSGVGRSVGIGVGRGVGRSIGRSVGRGEGLRGEGGRVVSGIARDVESASGRGVGLEGTTVGMVGDWETGSRTLRVVLAIMPW